MWRDWEKLSYGQYGVRCEWMNRTMIRLRSIRHSTWGKNRLRDENGKGTMGCGLEWGSCGRLVVGVTGMKGGLVCANFMQVLLVPIIL